MNPKQTGANRLPQRSYYLTHNTMEGAISKNAKGNVRYISLNGTWRFGYFASSDKVNLAKLTDQIDVPSCREMKGYGQIQYTIIN